MILLRCPRNIDVHRKDMWIVRPIYELLPYAYMLVGLGLLGAAWLLPPGPLPGLCLGVGVLGLTAGLVLWLRRRDYRTRQAQYNAHSLDD